VRSFARSAAPIAFEAVAGPRIESPRSFRIKVKTFATLPREGNLLHVFVDEAEREWLNGYST
jgi:hypothetical protein